MKLVRTLSFVLLSAAAFGAQAEAAKPVDTRQLVHQTVAFCAGGIERILPGQYYFCAAMRDYGRGHDGLSRERLRDAAYWASKPAQYVLGLMYYNGDSGPSNKPLGVAWLALAAERHDPRFEPAFAKAFLASTPEERAQANVYWRELREKYSDATAGQRAHRVYVAEYRNLQATMMFGGAVYIDGLTPPGISEDGSFRGGGGLQSARVTGQSGFSMDRLISKSAEDFFHGMEGTVTVGEAQMELVPIGDVATTGKPSAR